ncbi:hypothetical protein CSKR_103611 [Clonorchis sinensis]|uniref:Uncharacterized protein n=1 Tax=Clonorchis sinensis TaxID=79923 RepID=A0A3R7JPS2_CLOSI|nr:hypothetical protein CSKR_103611 [Clonorchis sinensis]
MKWRLMDVSGTRAVSFFPDCPTSVFQAACRLDYLQYAGTSSPELSILDLSEQDKLSLHRKGEMQFTTVSFHRRIVNSELLTGLKKNGMTNLFTIRNSKTLKKDKTTYWSSS